MQALVGLVALRVEQAMATHRERGLVVVQRVAHEDIAEQRLIVVGDLDEDHRVESRQTTRQVEARRAEILDDDALRKLPEGVEQIDHGRPDGVIADEHVADAVNRDFLVHFSS